MNTISLSVYSITLYKRFKNKDLENLSSFDHGKDLGHLQKRVATHKFL